jgi:hypothetical protein
MYIRLHIITGGNNSLFRSQKLFSEIQGHSKFEGLTLFRNVNHEGLDTVLVMLARYKCPVQRVYIVVYTCTLKHRVSYRN